jgi:putative ABC transport system permease protein
MFKYFFKIALRNLKKNKAYSVINVLGLAVGIAAFIMIALYIQYEYNFDKFNVNYDKIFRVEQKVKYSDGFRNRVETPSPLAAILASGIPEIVKSVKIRPVWGEFLSSGKKLTFYEEEGYYSENTFFNIFTCGFILGSPKTALVEPYSIVITKELAQKYFPGEYPLGKTIRAQNKYDYKVTAVINNYPKNSHLKLSYLVSFSTFEKTTGYEASTNWGDNGISTYILLQSKEQYKTSGNKIYNLLDKYIPQNNRKLVLRPLSQIHLHPDDETDLSVLIYLFGIIGLFALCIASMNSVNLTTAYATTRAKEIGIRKVVGANRITLIKHLLCESVIITFVSLLLAFSLVEVFLPEFDKVVGRQLEISIINNWMFTLGMVSVSFLVGLFSGSYPAFILSSFAPGILLKKNISGENHFHKIRMKKILVFVQFLLSIALIISTIIVYYQLEYMSSKNLGFNRENILWAEHIKSNNKYFISLNALKQALLQNPGILSVTISKNIPFHGYWDRTVNREGAGSDEKMNLLYNEIDPDFIKTYGMKIMEGRNFDKTISADKNACLINETAAKQFGWNKPLGKRLWNNKYHIIGVVKDFHQISIYFPIRPFFMVLNENNLEDENIFSIKVASKHDPEIKQFVMDKFEVFFHGDLFNFKYLEDDFDSETVRIVSGVSKSFGIFASITIILAIVGLFGTVSFITKLRTKEVAIRKVLGATLPELLLVLSHDMIKVMLFANLFACIIAYVLMNSILNQFAYRTDISIWIFLSVGFISFSISMSVVLVQIYKTATNNPVNSLRNE